MPRPTPYQRASAYINKSAPRAIAGSSGDNTTFAVACALVIEFALSDDEAWSLLEVYNRNKCTPPWEERDLVAKLRSARNMAKSKPSEVGRLLNEDRADYSGPSAPSTPARSSVPNRATTSAPTLKKAPTGPPRPKGSAPRTERTALFTVRKAGWGAEHRTARTLRTLNSYSLTKPVTTTPIPIDNKRLSEVSGVKEQAREVKKEEPKPVAKPMPAPAPAPTVKPSEPVKTQSSPPVARVPNQGEWALGEAVALETFALDQAKAAESGMVTICMKETGRVINVHATGKRTLMGVTGIKQ